MVEDFETVLSLAKMSSNSYEFVEDDVVRSQWYSIDPTFRWEDDFGWEDEGLRGYVYTNPDRSLVVMAIKGTSTIFFGDIGEDTIALDKFNDNIMFSCCCARVDVTWSPVCGCYEGNGVCKWKCLKESAQDSQLPVYYHYALRIFESLRQSYPKATIWLTGHSMGGSIASLLAMKYPGTSAVTFEAPGERLFAQRLGLLPRVDKDGDSLSSSVREEDLDRIMESLPIYHFYNSADPIPYGKCTGMWSLCYMAGYALETACHSGKVCEFDLGKDVPMDIQRHQLRFLIDDVMLGGHGVKTSIPACKVQRNCVDCRSWTYV